MTARTPAWARAQHAWGLAGLVLRMVLPPLDPGPPGDGASLDPLSWICRLRPWFLRYIASDMEEDNPTSKRSIFQFLLGREHWPDLYKEFLKLKVEFFHAMGHRAWVTLELCEEIQAQNPNHWVWSRVRQCAP
ncbi:hypothetical protein CB1_000688014 [Camelus ferus]|nr:hypothetical protein CB1_000688014 [Camelus ferus]